MQIADWLIKYSMTTNDLAKKMGVGKSTLYSAFEKKRGFRKRTAEKISKATNGEVSVVEAMLKPTKVPTDKRNKAETFNCVYCKKTHHLPRRLKETVSKAKKQLNYPNPLDGDQFLVICSFRYCLGRMTYVVFDMVRWLQFNWKGIHKENRLLIKKEIREAINKGRAGANYDEQKWEEILGLCD